MKFIATIAAILFAGAAAAQDWGGSYLSFGLGAVQGNSNHSWIGTPQGVDVTATGLAVSLTYGMNFDRGAMVYGFEGELAVSDAEGFSIGVNTPCVTPFEACRNQLNSYAALRGRIGTEIGSGLLAFATAGIVAADIDATADTGACAGTPCTVSGTVGGWSVGVGIERVVSNNWNLRADLTYMDFGSHAMDGASPGSNVEVDLNYTLFSVGVVRKF